MTEYETVGLVGAGHMGAGLGWALQTAAPSDRSAA
jgi:hypothetical protein